MMHVKKHIVCLGDSNTHGYCAENGGRFDENQRWTCLLQKKLGEDYLVLEEGLSGRTTCFDDPLTEGLSAMDYIVPCLMSHEPTDLLVIMLGTNDTKERFGVNATCISWGLRRLIRKAMAETDAWRGGRPNILVVTPQNIDKAYENTDVGPIMGKGCAEISEGLGEQYKIVAEQCGCHYLDANQILTVGPNQIDFMHLTEEGHRQLAEAFATKIKEIFA